jgi:transcriptional regulator GlxA family with amidase domain
MIQHNKDVNNVPLPTTLLKRELRQIRSFAKKIEKNISVDYTLEAISIETGLTQAKLQEGFKLLYNRTVTEYIRYARLNVARDYMVTTEMNISEIVYSIGFSSRSYFSKIFKERFGISPSEFLKKNRNKQIAA